MAYSDVLKAQRDYKSGLVSHEELVKILNDDMDREHEEYSEAYCEDFR